jgi:ABC-2 type transport system ATP-binding protein
LGFFNKDFSKRSAYDPRTSASEKLLFRQFLKENLEYFAGNRGHSRASIQSNIKTLLEQFHLEQKQGELVSNLSRGMQQKLAIIVAMLERVMHFLLLQRSENARNKLV